MLRSLILPLLAVIAFASLVWHVARTHEPPTVAAVPLPPVQRRFDAAVAGSGMVEPRSESIHVCAEVPGIVAAVAVAEGDDVAAGDVILRLEDRWQRAELAVRRAALAVAEQDRTRLAALPRSEDLPPSSARLRAARAAADSQRDQVARAEELTRRQVVTDEQLVQRRKALAVAEAEAEEAEAEDARLRAGAWERDVAIAAAAVEQAAARVAQAEIEVDRLQVRAPVAGRILRIDVRPGEFVGTPPDKPLVVLGDVSRLHVRVSIDEHDLPRFVAGAPAVGHVRGDATRALRLSFLRTVPLVEPKRSLTGDSAERIDTRVLQVLYVVEPDDSAGAAVLAVGQQLDVEIEAPAR